MSVDSRTAKLVRRIVRSNAEKIFNTKGSDNYRPAWNRYTQSKVKINVKAENLIRSLPGYQEIQSETAFANSVFYDHFRDTVFIPHPCRFRTTDHFYSDLFHEIAHLTGHPKRLSRTIFQFYFNYINLTIYQIRKEEVTEELTAELVSKCLCELCDLRPTLIYSRGFVKQLEDQNKYFPMKSMKRVAIKRARKTLTYLIEELESISDYKLLDNASKGKV